MRLVASALLYLAVFNISYAQVTSQVDSLEALLPAAPDTTKLHILDQLYQATVHQKPEQARQYAEDWLQLAQELNQPTEEISARLGVGRSYYVQGNFAAAIHQSEQALVIAESLQDTAHIASLYNGMGYMLFNQAKYDESLDFLLQGLRLKEGRDDSLAIHKSKFNIANVYVMTDQPRKAVDYYLACADYFHRHGDEEDVVRCWLNLGATYPDLQQYDSSYYYYQQALDFYEAEDDPYHAAKVLDGLGQNKLDQQQYAAAIAYYEQALKHNQAVQNRDGIALNYRDLGKAYNQIEQYDQALEYLHQAVALSEQADAPQELMHHYEALADTYAAKGDYKLAYEYRLQYFDRYQEVYNQEKEQQIAELETKYQLDKKEQEIALQAREIALLAQQNTLARYQRWGLIGGFLLVIALAAIWNNRQRMKVQKERELRDKDQLITQEKLRNAQLTQQQLRQELDFKNRELTTHALHLGQKTELLEEIKGKIHDLWAVANPRSKAEMKQLKQLLRGDQLIENDWDSFTRHFEQVHPDFSHKLQAMANELTPNEIRLAMMLRMNLSTKEIASITNISAEGVKKARYRLRKKLNLPIEENIQEFILQM